MEGLGIHFDICIKEIDETYPADLHWSKVPSYLCKRKADAFSGDEIGEGAVLITADTVVILEEKVLGKPTDRDDAVRLLKELSGKKHLVITGVCLKTPHQERVFDVTTEVWFRSFLDEEIEWYVDRFRPLDKAGAYGVQEWIGYVGIEHIDGSFYNVMGLPTQRLYLELLKLIGDEEVG